MRALGFTVIERDVPSNDAMLVQFPVVVLAATSVNLLPMIATRLRAKAGFSRRVIVARVPDNTKAEAIRPLLLCGIDDVFVEGTPARAVAARIVQRLRERPELACDYSDLPRTPAA